MEVLVKLVRAALLAAVAATAALGASAQTSPAGPYVVAALGRTNYDYDCWFLAACDNARATAGKIGGGWRFGVFAVEGWWIDYGNAPTQRRHEELHMRSLGLNAAWYLRLGSSVEGLLRAGAADVRHARSGDGEKRSLNATFGLGLVVDVAPSAALELAWDVTGADGNNSGSTLANSLSLGLRLRF
ncbi:MAG: outer membrane beta-barrel protein [Rubrivivax sp.]|nr:outer membrane beta-barrel protein [Rubrivivax sp.]